MTAKTSLRTILVTGASRGLGLAVARALLARGHRVVGLSRNQGPIEDAAFSWQICDFYDVAAASAALRAAFASYPIDAVVSNAGAPAFDNLEQWSPLDIAASITINLTSHLVVARHAVPMLRKRGQGDLIFMGSMAVARPGKKAVVYGAAKAGLRGLAQSLRYEVAGSGVRVSLVSPGMVDTEFYSKQSFRPGSDRDEHLSSTDVAACVTTVLESPAHVVFDEICVSPLKHVVRFGTSE